MKIKHFTYAIFFISLIQSFNYVFSQTQVEDKSKSPENLFNLAAAKHKQELQDLYVVRGGGGESWLRAGKASVQSVADALKVTGLDSANEINERSYPKDTAVLFYSYEQENFRIWLIDENGLKAYSSKKISERQINENIINLRDALKVNYLQLSSVPQSRGSDRILLDQSPKMSVEQSIANITDLLMPVAIADKLATTKQLIVVPVLGVGTVPFALLKPFDTNSFLIDKMSITIAPSLFDLGQRLISWDTYFRSPLIVGNPYLPTNSKQIVSSLPGAEAEAQAVAKMLRVSPLLGKNATKEVVVSRALTADFMYFATHGIADSDNPLSNGFLMLSASTFEAGWWTAKEIQEQRFRGFCWKNEWCTGAKIAILSACQTGLGKVHPAGMIGLARAFQIAGVPRVVMSLWNVNDATTNKLMQLFMKHLMDGYIPSEALRQAMLEIKKQQPKLSEWAGFTVFGTPR